MILDVSERRGWGTFRRACRRTVSTLRHGTGRLSLMFLLFAATSAGAADDAMFRTADVQDLRYAIFAEGERVGEAHGTIRHLGDHTWQVHTRIEITVGLGPIPIYDLEMDVTSRYESGLLASFRARTTENGDVHEVKGRIEDGHFRYTYNNSPGSAPRTVVPSLQVWRMDFLDRRQVLHAIEGRVFERRAEPLGTRNADGDDGTRALTGFHIATEDESADLWYGKDGLLERAEWNRLGTALVIKRM